jgi:cytochrome P450
VTTTTVPALDEIDLSDPEVHLRGETHALWKVLRREAPVHWNRSRSFYADFWSITRYDDVVAISRNPQLFSSAQGIATPPREPQGQGVYSALGKMLIVMDPPRHVRLRRLVNKGFTPRAVAMLEPEIRAITRDFITEIEGRGRIDFVTELAANIPLAVICRMMGVPREDWALMFRLTNKLLGAGDIEYQDELPEGVERGTPEAARATGMLGTMGMFQYFTPHIARLRQGQRGDDIVSILVDAEIDGEKLTDEEVLWFCLLLIVAGNETTRNAMSGGLLAFSENPGEREKLRRNPALIDSAVEEIVRYVSPVTHMLRTATADTEIRGVKIAEGDRLVMWYPSVNRDEDVFPDGDRFDIERSPNDHLAFGIGEHFCLGAGFARLELKVLFQELFERLPDIEVAGPVERLRSNFIGGIKHLPVAFTPR